MAALTLTDLLEWTSVILNIAFAYLLGREKRFGWLTGFVASAIGVYLYAGQQAWLMAALNFFYAVMGVYGWIHWGRDEAVLPVVRLSGKGHALWIVVMIAGSAVLVALMRRFTADHDHLLMEAFITASALVATWLMSRKILESWLYYLVGDAVGVVYNHLIGFEGYAVLMMVYIVLAVIGFVRWRREMIRG